MPLDAQALKLFIKDDMQSFNNLFDIANLMPHGYCLVWNSALLWLHVLSDGLITLAYYSIPLVLIYFIRKHKNFPFNKLLLMFAAFIMVCGTTHLLSIITIWVPLYWLEGFLKLLTGLLSAMTAIAMTVIVPRALANIGRNQYLEHELVTQADEIHDINESIKTEKALRESELLWKFALEGSGDGVWDWNIKTDNAVYSKRWKEMLDYTEDDILPSNQEWQARIHPEDQAMVANTMQAYLEKITPIYRVEYRLKCKNGSYKWILGRGMIVSLDSQGQPLRMIGTHTDITPFKEAVELIRKKHKEIASHEAKLIKLNLLNQTRKTLQKVNKQITKKTLELQASNNAQLLKSQALSNMSHEIITPITTIRTIAALTLQSDLTAQQHNYLSEIDSSAKWLLETFEDFLFENVAPTVKEG